MNYPSNLQVLFDSENTETEVRHNLENLVNVLTEEMLNIPQVRNIEPEYIDSILNTISSSSMLFPPMISLYNDVTNVFDPNREDTAPKKVLTQDQFNKLSKGYSTKTCNICLEVNNDSVVLPCGHFFHEECISKWLLEKSISCPTCRKDVLIK
jgi:hypothetical protein